jgi:hypothetical protein
MTSTFSARVEPTRGGGHYVVVPAKVTEAAGLRLGMRVRGTVNETRYRSSLMKYRGMLLLGVHKATLVAAGVTAKDRVRVSIERDDEPRPTDTVPADLARALRRRRTAGAAWKRLAPSIKRYHVGAVTSAKNTDTRKRRIERIIAALAKRAKRSSR